MVIAAAGVAAAGIVTLAGKISGGDKNKQDTPPAEPGAEQPGPASAPTTAQGLSS